jgi:hypothetical protein
VFYSRFLTHKHIFMLCPSQSSSIPAWAAEPTAFANLNILKLSSYSRPQPRLTQEVLLLRAFVSFFRPRPNASI